MKFDTILAEVGVFGRYQLVICLLISLTAIPAAWHAIGQVFLAAKTDHWCVVPETQSLNCSSLGLDSSDCLESQKELTLPLTVDKDGNTVYSKCERYVNARSPGQVFSSLTGGQDEWTNETIECDAGWEYDRSQYKTTLIQDFDLVCVKESLPGLAQSVYFAGFLFGSFFWGAVADWFGRRFVFFAALCVGVAATTAAAFVQNMAAYTALRFFIAAGNFGVYLISFIIVTEIVGPAYRTMVGTFLSVMFSIGYALLAFIAYNLREWRNLQLAISFPVFVFFAYIFFLPESPRWLISKKKFKQAEKIIKTIAKVNKTVVPENMFTEEDTLQEKKSNIVTRQPTQIDLFRTPNMRKKSLNVFFNWFVNSLVYYGLSLSTSNLGVDDYVAAFISGAVELPGYLSSWFVIQRWGRRLPLALYLGTGGVACLTTIFISPGVARAAVAMIGKFAISGSFNVIYIYSVELYPTPIRSMGMGMSSMFARISGIIAPVILILGNFWEPLPLIVFGSCSLLAGVLALLLPETLNRDLPETIQEGEDYGKGQGFGLKNLFKKPSAPPAGNDASGTDKNYKQIPTDEKKATNVPEVV